MVRLWSGIAADRVMVCDALPSTLFVRHNSHVSSTDLFRAPSTPPTLTPSQGSKKKQQQQNKKAAKKAKKAAKFNPYGHGEQVKRVSSSASRALLASGERSISARASKRR